MLIFRLAAVMLFVTVMGLPTVRAQRIFATVQPPDIEGVRFDTNDIPLTTTAGSISSDLNFSPNIVFGPASDKAFVSFSGSNLVMVYDCKTAEVIQTIEVPENPTLLSLSPEGTTLAVPSVRLKENLPTADSIEGKKVGSLSLIDTNSLEVRTLDLTEVGFSVANNILFSQDGTTGFIASARTDQLIRFDVATMTEIEPRLDFDGGTRPISMTMAPDYSFFTVVLVGSSALPQSEVPDSIQIVDPEAFRVIRSVVPDPTEVTTSNGSVVRIPHNFLAANNLSISPDGKWGIIADSENSLSTSFPDLSNDHALLIDLETGTLEEVFTIGGVGGPSSVSRQGMFAVVSAVDVSLIDPDEKTSLRSGTLISVYRESSRPVFSIDGTQLFVAAPIRDQISVIDVATGALRTQAPVALDYVPEAVNVPAAPLDLAVSPDGKVLAALNFNAGTIDLLAESARIMIPEFLSNEDWFTGVALTNNSALQTASVIAKPVGRNGISITDSISTDNPVTIRKTTDNGTTYTNYTNSAVVLSGLNTLANGDWLVIGYTNPFSRIVVDIEEANSNASVLSVHYWNGTQWTEVSGLFNSTVSGSATFGTDGTITFSEPADWELNSIDGVSAYHVRLTVSAALDDSTSGTFSVGGVDYAEPVVTLEPNHQAAFTPLELLEGLPVDEVEGWLDMDSNVLDVSAFYLTGDTDILRLDGALANRQIFQSYIIPEVILGRDFYARIQLANPNFTSDSLTIDLIDSSGEVVGTSEQGLASWAAPERFIYPPSHAAISIRRTSDGGTSYTDYTNRGIVFDGMDTMANGHWVIVSYTAPFFRFRVDIVEPNENASVSRVEYWDGTQWLSGASTSDGTSVDGATLAKDGTIGFQIASTWTESVIDGVSAYHARFSVSAPLDDSVSANTIDVGLASEADAIFSRDILSEDESYYVVVNSKLGTITGERFYNDDFMAVLAGLPMDTAGGEARPLYIPQAVAFGGTESTLNLINTASEAANVTLTLLADNGTILAGPVAEQLGPSNKLQQNVDDLFGLSDPGHAVSGWILAESDQPGLVGNVTLYLFSRRAASALALQNNAANNFVFSHVAEGLGYSTGVSLLNINREPTFVRLSVHNPDGTLVDSLEEVITPNSRLIGLLREFFPGLPTMLGGFIRVESDLPIVGVELFYTNDQEVLSAVPAQILPTEEANLLDGVVTKKGAAQ